MLPQNDGSEYELYSVAQCSSCHAWRYRAPAHIQAIERMAAVRRGEIREKVEEEEIPPRWTPFPGNPTLNRLRKTVLLELGPFSVLVYVVIFLNAMVLCFDSADASDRTELVLSEVNFEENGGFIAGCEARVRMLGGGGVARGAGRANAPRTNSWINLEGLCIAIC